MADGTTQTAINYFQQLRNRQNDLYRKNTAELIMAAKAGDIPMVTQLRHERAKLTENDKAILDAEICFATTQIDQSEAETRLIAQVQSANKLIREMNTLTDVLRSAEKMAVILTRLTNLLT